MTTTSLVPQQSGDLVTVDIMEDFGKFLRLHTADGDASPATIQGTTATRASSWPGALSAASTRRWRRRTT
jgi:hypothetical protein